MEIPPGQRKFECEHCQAEILVPIDLPPTTAPCPVCQEITTSPGPEELVVEGLTSKPEELASAREVDVEPVKERPSEASSEKEPLDHRDYEPIEEKKSGAGLLWAIAGLLFLGLLAGAFFLFNQKKADPPSRDVLTPEENVPSSTHQSSALEAGQMDEETLQVLRKFLAATSVEERAKTVIGKESMIPKMKAFYKGDVIVAEDLRPDFFTETLMEQSDQERGIKLLQFERPSQVKLGSFPPIFDVEVGTGLAEADIQTRFRSQQQFLEMEAIRAQVFLKKVEGEFLVDWETYIQTKNRTLRDFVGNPDSGKTETFRILLTEDISTTYEKNQSLRNYRLSDPTHYKEDWAIVTVQRDSKIGKLLEKYAWTDVSGKSPNNTNSSATVRLRWSNDQIPVLELAEVICWEFLGVGGDPSNLSR